jgi:hypothetical protein
MEGATEPDRNNHSRLRERYAHPQWLFRRFSEFHQACPAKAALVMFTKFFPRFRAELYLKTPAPLERRATNERIAASLTFARRARLRIDEFFQFTQHGLED